MENNKIIIFVEARKVVPRIMILVEAQKYVPSIINLVESRKVMPIKTYRKFSLVEAQMRM